MPYLTCIGGHGSAGRTEGGVGSRRYWIFRRGTAIIRRFGAVRVLRNRTVSIQWLWLREAPLRRRGSVNEAKAELTSLVQEKIQPAHGYRLLKRGVRITRKGRRKGLFTFV